MTIRREYGLIGLVVLILIIGLGLVAYQRRMQQNQTSDLLQALWQNYKLHVWDSRTGRTIDEQSMGRTTSEGQAYTMLRAVWANDPSTFASTWQWTTLHLQRSDHLFSWLWGKEPDGSGGILVRQGGQNTASDADTDIALALLMAYGRWHNHTYLNEAQSIIQSIWQEEIVIVQGVPYLAADNVEKTSSSSTIIINPSYFSPYAYRLFAKVDKANDWQALIASSYELIRSASLAKLGADKSDDLPPDWIAMNRMTGSLQAVAGLNHTTTDFGYDAFRVVWRVGLDWQWFHDGEALQTLKQFGFLGSTWQRNHRLEAVYSHNGSAKADYASLALYGGVLPYFQYTHPASAQAIVKSQLAPLLSESSRGLMRPLSYYDNNWVWFGLALYSGRLLNFAHGAAQ